MVTYRKQTATLARHSTISSTNCNFAKPQSMSARVCFGSITDIADGWRNVRFTSKSRHYYAVVMLAGRIGTPDPYDAQSGVKVYVDV